MYTYVKAMTTVLLVTSCGEYVEIIVQTKKYFHYWPLGLIISSLSICSVSVALCIITRHHWVLLLGVTMSTTTRHQSDYKLYNLKSSKEIHPKSWVLVLLQSDITNMLEPLGVSMGCTQWHHQNQEQLKNY